MTEEERGVCGTCRYYWGCLGASSGRDQIILREMGTCKDWTEKLTEEDLEAQRTDAAERENHRKDVEGEL